MQHLSDVAALVAIRAVLVMESVCEFMDNDSTHAPEAPALQIRRGIVEFDSSFLAGIHTHLAKPLRATEGIESTGLAYSLSF